MQPVILGIDQTPPQVSKRDSPLVTLDWNGQSVVVEPVETTTAGSTGDSEFVCKVVRLVIIIGDGVGWLTLGWMTWEMLRQRSRTEWVR